MGKEQKLKDSKSKIKDDTTIDLDEKEQLKIICNYILDCYLEELREKEEKYRINTEKKTKKISGLRNQN